MKEIKVKNINIKTLRTKLKQIFRLDRKNYNILKFKYDRLANKKCELNKVEMWI